MDQASLDEECDDPYSQINSFNDESKRPAKRNEKLQSCTRRPSKRIRRPRAAVLVMCKFCGEGDNQTRLRERSSEIQVQKVQLLVRHGRGRG